MLRVALSGFLIRRLIARCPPRLAPRKAACMRFLPRRRQPRSAGQPVREPPKIQDECGLIGRNDVKMLDFSHAEIPRTDCAEGEMM